MVVLAALVGLGARGDFEETWTLVNLAPAAGMALAVLLVPWIYVTRALAPSRKVGLLAVFAVLILLASTLQPQTEVSLRKFQPAGSFWPENLHCLLIGLLASGLASLWLDLAFYKWLPTPNQRWQGIASLTAGATGLLALTLHCMGPLWSHIAVSHWGQALVLFPVAALQQRWLFRRRMNQVVGGRSALKSIEKLGE